MKLEMVFSAPNMLRLQGVHTTRDTWKLSVDAVHTYMNSIRQRCSEKIDFSDFDISILHNAYYEPEFGFYARKHDIFGFSKLYCDSGGLQIVSAGKAIDDETKKTIYKNQSPSDYAFCFDEIPTRDLRKSSRADISSKVFYPENFEECAIKTAHNINKQINSLMEMNSTAKVFYIVQGNTIKDMIDWVSYGWNIIEHPEYIAGFAVADTCMGNGLLESIDMMIVYAILSQQYNLKRLHLLGVGSASRLLPVITLFKRGILSDDYISFDSSTLSQSFLYGRFNFNQETVSISDESGYVNNLQPRLKEVYEITKHHFPDISFDDLDTHFKNTFKKITRITENTCDEPIHVYSRALVIMLLVEQTISLCDSIKALYTSDSSELRMFENANSLEDLIRIRNEFSKYIHSKRIHRNSNISLLDFME